jgi:replicative DNA helicase
MAELKTPEHLRAQEAERATLGTILLDPNSFDLISAILEPDDFHEPRHQLIYRAMRSMASNGTGINIVSVITALKQEGELESVGGDTYILELGTEVGTSLYAESYAIMVYRAAEVRRLIALCARIIEKGQQGDYEHSEELFDDAQQRILALGSRKSRQAFTSFSDAIAEALSQIQKAFEVQSSVTGTKTGFTEFDHITSGLQPGDLVILAARPGMGKTALALNMAFNAATNPAQPCTVAIFSLEMPTIQLATRILSSESQISSHNLKTGMMEEHEIDRLVETVERVKDVAIFIDDTAGLSIMDCRSKCRRLAGDENLPPLGLIIIDYLQLMKGPPNAGNREQEISEISRNLKTLAKELNTPVVALSQLNRGVESRPNKRPLLSDLRESGAIEQDADKIMFVYRDDYYNEESEEKGIAELILAKHRAGSTGTTKLQFVGMFTRFNNLADDDQPF